MNFCITALPNKFASCGLNYDDDDDNDDGKDIDNEDHTHRNNGQEEGVENDHLNSEN